jgi:uncharacterized membrane protein YkvA (DUF1232 family)
MISLFKDFIIQLVLVIFIISPIDIVPDIMPVVGWIDDVFAVNLFFVKLNKYIKIFTIIKIALKIFIPVSVILGCIFLIAKIITK